MDQYPGKMRRAQDSRKRDIVHIVQKTLQVSIRKDMTANHGNYGRN